MEKVADVAHTRAEKASVNSLMKKTIKEKLEQHKVEIINLYLVENKTQAQIAEQFGTSQNNIYKLLERHGVRKQKKRKAVSPKPNTLKAIWEQFKVKIYYDPETHYYFITDTQGEGVRIRNYISKNFTASRGMMIYIIPEGFGYKFSKLTTKSKLIYPKSIIF